MSKNVQHRLNPFALIAVASLSLFFVFLHVEREQIEIKESRHQQILNFSDTLKDDSTKSAESLDVAISNSSSFDHRVVAFFSHLIFRNSFSFANRQLDWLAIVAQIPPPSQIS